VRVLPVSSVHEEYAGKVVEQLRAAGARVDSVGADDGLGRRIRAAKLEKVPYVLVVGDDDVAAATVGVNPRGGEVERTSPSPPPLISLNLCLSRPLIRGFSPRNYSPGPRLPATRWRGW